MANIEAATNKDFEQVVLKSETPVLVDFFAEWCGPCKTLSPIIEELAQEFDGKIKFVKVDIDVDGNKDLAVKYDVSGVPTLIIFKNGEINDKTVGVTSKKKLTQKIEQVLS